MVYKRGTPEYNRWRKSPEYDLWRERISVANKGKSRSEETKQNISKSKTGERNPNYGKHLSPEIRRKISSTLMGRRFSDTHCQRLGETQTGKQNPMYGKHHSAKTRASMSVAHMGKHPNVAARAKMGRPMNGEQNPNWRGGISFLPYSMGWDNSIRELIRKRDNYTCVLCGDIQSERQHDVHHINYDKEDLCPENLITLCRSCHTKTNYDREYWENLFQMVYIPDFPKERMKTE